VLTPTIAANQPARIAIDVTNNGSRPGDEVVQLYIHDDEASVTRPVIELKRFQRLTLRPGERRTVTFELGPDDLALWNPDMKKVVEPGTFTIFAGPNSVDLKSAKLTVTGAPLLIATTAKPSSGE
jgi:beta-glucosidase